MFKIGDITDADMRPNQLTRVVVRVDKWGVSIRKLRDDGNFFHLPLSGLYLKVVCTSFRKRP